MFVFEWSLVKAQHVARQFLRKHLVSSVSTPLHSAKMDTGANIYKGTTACMFEYKSSRLFTSFRAMDVVLAKNLLHAREKMLVVNDAAPAGQEEARVERFRAMDANISKVIVLAENLFQARNTMVFADNAVAKAKPAGGAAGKVIASIDLTHSDSDSDVQVVEDLNNDKVQIVGQRAVP